MMGCARRENGRKMYKKTHAMPMSTILMWLLDIVTRRRGRRLLPTYFARRRRPRIVLETPQLRSLGERERDGEQQQVRGGMRHGEIDITDSSSATFPFCCWWCCCCGLFVFFFFSPFPSPVTLWCWTSRSSTRRMQGGAICRPITRRVRGCQIDTQ